MDCKEAMDSSILQTTNSFIQSLIWIPKGLLRVPNEPSKTHPRLKWLHLHRAISCSFLLDHSTFCLSWTDECYPIVDSFSNRLWIGYSARTWCSSCFSPSCWSSFTWQTDVTNMDASPLSSSLPHSEFLVIIACAISAGLHPISSHRSQNSF